MPPRQALAHKPFVIFKVTWLHKYEGEEADPAFTEGDYNPFERFDGWDVFNFAPTRLDNFSNEVRYYIDYFGIHSKLLNLSKLKMSSDKDARTLGPVTIILIAQKPRTADHVIVGWYKNAIIYRQMQVDKPAPEANPLDPVAQFQAYAPIEKASRLLPVKNRNFRIPLDAIGSGPVWYGPELPVSQVSLIWQYIDQFPV